MLKLKPSLMAIAAGLALSAQAAEFRSADIHNADDYPTVVAVKHMSTVLDKLSGGKHKIKVFNKGALGSEKETIDQVKIGALDMVRVNVAPMNGVCPMTMVPTMPFLFRSVEHMRHALDALWVPKSSRAAKPQATWAWLFMTAVPAPFTPRKPSRAWPMPRV